MTGGLAQGVGKLKELEFEVHIRAKRFQRKLAALSVAILIAILGVGLFALAGYNAFLEITSPALAALYAGLALFAVCGFLLYFATLPKVLNYGLRKKVKS